MNKNLYLLQWETFYMAVLFNYYISSKREYLFIPPSARENYFLKAEMKGKLKYLIHSISLNPKFSTIAIRWLWSTFKFLLVKLGIIFSNIHTKFLNTKILQKCNFILYHYFNEIAIHSFLAIYTIWFQWNKQNKGDQSLINA